MLILKDFQVFSIFPARTTRPLLACNPQNLPQLSRSVRPPATSEHRATMGSAMNYQERIVRDPHVIGGEPVLRGTRVTLKTVLASLAEGATTGEILADFPTLSEEDVRAAIAFAATSAQEDLPVAEIHVKR